ncbi:MAG: ATP-binding cassette domain-containing protein [Rhodospirillaceae bacterium]|nr:ATP-binding cassette domain-containing protein [Rhodospirillaceae bacterium]
MSDIVLDRVSTIFGPKPDVVWPLLAEGASKADILARTGHTVALDAVTLRIEPGEIFAVMGPSGSGKSTLLRLVNLLIRPTRGAVMVAGQDLQALADAPLRAFRRATIAMVFQNFGLLPHRSVADNIAFPLELQGMAKAQRRLRAAAWIERIGLSGYAAALPGELSSGMQQRVGLARALATEAPVLLMDEPLAALDPVTRRDMQDEILRLQADLKKTVVMITHDPAEALRMADRVAVIRDGVVVQVGTMRDLTLRPADDGVAAFVRGFGPAAAPAFDARQNRRN